MVTELGHDCARQLVRDVEAVEAAGGMSTKDGCRNRTPCGVFFVLAYERLGSKRAKAVRWRASFRFHEGMLRRFLRLLALVSPAKPALATASIDGTLAPLPLTPVPASTAALSKPVPTEPAASTASTAAATPTTPLSATTTRAARRQEPEVEILVVRRRPVASASSTGKPGPSTPNGGR